MQILPTFRQCLSSIRRMLPKIVRKFALQGCLATLRTAWADEDERVQRSATPACICPIIEQQTEVEVHPPTFEQARCSSSRRKNHWRILYGDRLSRTSTSKPPALGTVRSHVFDLLSGIHGRPTLATPGSGVRRAHPDHRADHPGLLNSLWSCHACLWPALRPIGSATHPD